MANRIEQHHRQSSTESEIWWTLLSSVAALFIFLLDSRLSAALP